MDKDVVIVGSDGIWDNLYDEMILNIVNGDSSMTDGILLDCDSTAKNLAELAEKLSLDE